MTKVAIVICPHCGDRTEQEFLLHEFTCGACDRPFNPSSEAIGLLPSAETPVFCRPLTTGGYGLFLHLDGPLDPTTLRHLADIQNIAAWLRLHSTPGAVLKLPQVVFAPDVTVSNYSELLKSQ